MGMRGSALVSKFALTIYLARFVGLEAVGYYGFIAGAAAIFPVIGGFGIIQSLGRILVTQKLAGIYFPLLRYWRLLIVAYVGIYLIGYVSKVVADVDLPFSGLTAALITAILLLEHLNNDAFIIASNMKRPLFANIQIFFRSAGWIIVYIPTAWVVVELRSMLGLLAFWMAGIIFSLAIFFAGTLHSIMHARNQTVAMNINSDLRFRSAWKLYCGDICNSLSFYIDRYLIGVFIGVKEAGVYILFSSLGMGIYNLANTGVMQVYRPYLIEFYGKQDLQAFMDVHARCTRKAMTAVLVIAVSCGVAFPYLAPFLNQPLVNHYEWVLWLVLGGAVIRVASDLQGYVFYTRNEDGIFALTTGFSLIVATMSNFMLVPLWGIVGGGIACVATYTLTLGLRSMLVKRELLSAQSMANFNE